MVWARLWHRQICILCNRIGRGCHPKNNNNGNEPMPQGSLKKKVAKINKISSQFRTPHDLHKNPPKRQKLIKQRT